MHDLFWVAAIRWSQWRITSEFALLVQSVACYSFSLTTVSLIKLSYAVLGTHDSGSHAITADSPISPDMKYGAIVALFGLFINTNKEDWAVTQRANITKQLQGGIRYLDLRVAHRRITPPNLLASEQIGNFTGLQSNFYLVHGQYANRLRVELDEVKRFLLQHPREVVILDFQHFHHFRSLDRIVFEAMLTSVSCVIALRLRLVKLLILNYRKSWSVAHT